MELRIKKREFERHTGDQTKKKAPRAKKASATDTEEDVDAPMDPEQLKDERETLFSQLVVLRDEFEHDEQFRTLMTNDILDKLLDDLPSTIDEMAAVEGVGQKRATKCGRIFVDKINEVVLVLPLLARIRAQKQAVGTRATPGKSGHASLRRFQYPGR